MPADSKRAVDKLIIRTWEIACRRLPKEPLRMTDFDTLFVGAAFELRSPTLYRIYEASHHQLMALQQNSVIGAAVHDGGGKEHDSRLEEIKALIDGFNPNQALTKLNELRNTIFNIADSKVKYRILSYTGICHLRNDRHRECGESLSAD